MSVSTSKLNYLRKIIKESRYLVCMIGTNMKSENGYPIMRDSDWAYDMEMKYNDSPEEIFNSSFFATRKEKFYNFYRNEMLSCIHEPNENYKALKRLEDEGNVKAIITTDIYSLPLRAGCRNVIEIHGSIYDNYCTHCRKKYGVDYIRNSVKVPTCEECNSVVRPGVFLFGEMVDNKIMTRAMEEVSKADVLMICGGNLISPNVIDTIQYFNGDNVIIINEESHYSDDKAMLVINDKVKNVLPHIWD